jgi:hypothetical protein
LRSSGLKPAVALIFCAALPVLGLPGPIGVPRQSLILTDGLRSVYALEHRMLVNGTDSVFVDGSVLDSTGYEIDYARARVLLKHRPGPWHVVRVAYRCIGFSDTDGTWRLYQPAPPSATEGTSDTTSVRLEPGADVDLYQGDLVLSGSKSLGVSVGGPEGSGINQSTRLTLAGKLEGVNIDAELSDQSSPIPPEGTTRDIEELDRIVIAVSGERWQGSFGDVEFRLPARGFGTLKRRAIGGQAAAGFGPAEVSAGYARPKGAFARLTFDGIDGIQGPYVLAADRRSAQIVPGSEEVYLDGIPMTRGWDQDYTIDYSTGELVFTNRRIITRLSRIEASFQYVTEDYARDDITGYGSFALGPAGISVGLFREGDDPDNPFAEDITPEQREHLGSIGADTSRAWVRGDSFVGEGNGSYVLEDGHFRHVGEDNGDYQVRFTLVGSSLGDYVYDDSLLALRYVGPGLGDYAPLVRIALPERQEIVTAQAGFQHSGVTGSATGVFRRQLRNLFAPDGAALDKGAGLVSVGWQNESYAAAYRGRVQAHGFLFPGADSLIDFSHRWGGTTAESMVGSHELTLSASPLGLLDLTGEAGILETSPERQVRRYLGRIRLGFATAEASLAGPEDRQSLRLSPVIGSFRPTAGVELRTRKDYRHRSYTGGLTFSPADDLEAGASYTQLEADVPDSSGAMAHDESGGIAEASARWRREGLFSLQARAGHQHADYVADTRQDWNQLFGNVAATFTPLTGVRLQGDLSQTNRQVQLRDEQFRYVGPRQGDYSRDSTTGRYYFDADGDYERFVVATGEFSTARERTVSASGQVSALHPVLVDGSFSLTDAATDSSLLQRLTGHNLRTTIRALEPLLTTSLGATGSRSLDRTLASTGRGSFRDLYYVEMLSYRVPSLDLRARFEITEAEREFAAGVLDYAEDAWRAEIEPVITGKVGLEIRGSYEHSWIEEPTSYPPLGRFALVTSQAGLARNWSLGRSTRFRTSAAAVHRSSSVAELPYDIELTRPVGWTPSATAELTHLFSTILTASLRYRFEDRPDRSISHELSGEIRAYF